MKHGGARLNVKYLRPDLRRDTKARKCPVCLKAIRNENKLGLCNKDRQREEVRNLWYQVYKKLSVSL